MIELIPIHSFLFIRTQALKLERRTMIDMIDRYVNVDNILILSHLCFKNKIQKHILLSIKIFL